MIDHKEKDSKLKSFIREYRPEIKFVLTFSIGLVIGFLLIHNETVGEKVIEPITVVETYIASQVLNVIGFPNEQSGLYISGIEGNTFRMQVLNTCNGVYESVIFLMAFIAIQVPWRRKIGWMTFGFLFFHFVNELRLVSLFIVGTKYSTETFVFFHETFWNYAVVIVALGTFIFCANQVSKSPVAQVPVQEGAGA
ncbi:MAG: archaeosortase/exosortase family protein [Acidobacteriota bacterium]|nr:archaeosortase/exosortase family protein [Acidobacteriota bacterium]